jgi:hypothetical protein
MDRLTEVLKAASVKSLCLALLGPLLNRTTAAVVCSALVLVVPVPATYSPHSLLGAIGLGPAVVSSTAHCLLQPTPDRADGNDTSQACPSPSAAAGGAQAATAGWLSPALAWTFLALLFCVLKLHRQGDYKKGKSEIQKAIGTLRSHAAPLGALLLLELAACVSGGSTALGVGIADALLRALTLLQICADCCVDGLGRALARSTLCAPTVRTAALDIAYEYAALVLNLLREGLTKVFLHGPEWSLMGASLGFWNLPTEYGAPHSKELVSKVCGRILFISETFWLEHSVQCVAMIEDKVAGSVNATMAMSAIGGVVAAVFWGRKLPLWLLRQAALGVKRAWLRLPMRLRTGLKALPALPLLVWTLNDVRLMVHTTSTVLAESALLSSFVGSVIIVVVFSIAHKRAEKKVA